MRETGGKKKGNRHFHVGLTEGNEERREDEKKKGKEDEVNKFIIKCAQAQLRGKRKGVSKRKRKRRRRGKYNNCFGGQLSPSMPVWLNTMRALKTY